MPGSEGEKIKANTVLELNPDHAVYQTLMDLQASGSEKLADYAKLLYDQALLIAGMPIEDPVAFSNRICDLMK
jgi:molecular chaperone HtpG